MVTSIQPVPGIAISNISALHVKSRQFAGHKQILRLIPGYLMGQVSKGIKYKNMPA